MKKFLTFSLLLISVASFAQTQSGSGKYGPFLTNKFFDNWFISAGGGVNVYVGEEDSKASIGYRMTPALDISLGKWFTPTLGIRAQYAGLSAKGVTSNNSLARFVDGASSDYPGYYDEKFNFFHLHGDVLWNASNALAGYKADRTWDFIPFFGAGYARSWKQDVHPVFKEVGFNVGLLNNFRLSDAVDFNVEFRVMMVNGRFDGYKVGQGIEEIPSLTIGLGYNFAKRDFEKPAPPVVPDYSPYTKKIGELESQLADKDAKAKQLASDLDKEKNKPAKEIIHKEVLVPAVTVMFKIGKSDINEREMINIQNFADAVKKVPGKVYTIMGIADKQTGTSKKNQTLSEMRAKKVYDALVNKFGVDPNMLKLDPKGDTYQPYGKAFLNRVAIIENK
jgi:outer membrane protein OmpA-like peptidoglycan-associated protein